MRAYGKLTGDYALQDRVDVQTGIRLILKLCLTDGFDMFPSLLVTDGSCMIDRRMGIHGHPLEIQVNWLLVIIVLYYEFHSSKLICTKRDNMFSCSVSVLSVRLFEQEQMMSLSFNKKNYSLP